MTEVRCVGSEELASNQNIENEPSKFRSFGFAIALIFGVGGLVVAGVGIGGVVQAGALTSLGQLNAIVMIVIGGAAGVPLLIIGIVGFVNKCTHENTKPLKRNEPETAKKVESEKQEAKQQADLEAQRIQDEKERAEVEAIVEAEKKRKELAKPKESDTADGYQDPHRTFGNFFKTLGLDAKDFEDLPGGVYTTGQVGTWERNGTEMRFVAANDANNQYIVYRNFAHILHCTRGITMEQQESLTKCLMLERSGEYQPEPEAQRQARIERGKAAAEKKMQALEEAKRQEELEKLKKEEQEKEEQLKKEKAAQEAEEKMLGFVQAIEMGEVGPSEITTSFAAMDESQVLQILALTQTSAVFNAIDEKIIEKALIVETNFIQAVNKKCPHRNPVLREKIKKRLLGPSIFSHSMDDAEIVKIGTAFFEDLKKSGQLLTSEQFEAYPDKDYRFKGVNFNRILGAQYIKKVAAELGLKHIKVPKKIAVVKENTTELVARVEKDHLDLSCSAVTIYAEKITRLSRETTRDEVIDLLKILEATGFADFLGDGPNFFLGKNPQGEEGIYFVDTEYTNFRHNPFLEHGVEIAIRNLVQDSDLNWINEAERYPRYKDANRDRIHRYRDLYQLQDLELYNLVRTYIPENQRRKKDVTFTYTLTH